MEWGGVGWVGVGWAGLNRIGRYFFCCTTVKQCILCVWQVLKLCPFQLLFGYYHPTCKKPCWAPRIIMVHATCSKRCSRPLPGTLWVAAINNHCPYHVPAAVIHPNNSKRSVTAPSTRQFMGCYDSRQLPIPATWCVHSCVPLLSAAAPLLSANQLRSLLLNY